LRPWPTLTPASFGTGQRGQGAGSASGAVPRVLRNERLIYGTDGQRFESCRARLTKILLPASFVVLVGGERAITGEMATKVATRVCHALVRRRCGQRSTCPAHEPSGDPLSHPA
jgi:hypothetical protein